MIAYENIRDVHLEISSLCNAACPWCPRTFWGYPHNGGYPEVNLSLDNVKHIFSPDFIKQLGTIRVNGNYGDLVMNSESPDIVEYFLWANPDLNISVSTNGSARSRQFWQRLGHQGIKIDFCIDGLEDTHHLYRQQTSWKQIIRNAGIFMEAGGRAVWKMLEFDHNRHQIDECQRLSKQLGFDDFNLVKTSRNSAPVFDRRGQLVHIMGDYRGETNFEILFHRKTTDTVLLEDITSNRVPKNGIACETKRLKSIYIAANGDVSPCCYTGFYPRTYGHGQYHQAANAQLTPLVTKNNALEFSLRETIEWFNEVEKSWSHRSYEQGRLIICDDNCGS